MKPLPEIDKGYPHFYRKYLRDAWEGRCTYNINQWVRIHASQRQKYEDVPWYSSSKP
jgi:hypothetical protein